EPGECKMPVRFPAASSMRFHSKVNRPYVSHVPVRLVHSNWQTAEQPSPSRTLLSSNSSPGSPSPFPHTYAWTFVATHSAIRISANGRFMVWPRKHSQQLAVYRRADGSAVALTAGLNLN